MVVPVRTARVVCANYRAIVHDFPQVFGPEARRERPLIGCGACAAADRLCPQAINAWLIRNSAFVSQQQAVPNEVNSPIETGDGLRPAFRPPRYGRGLVVPIDRPASPGQAGFLDLKGAGVAPGRTPSHRPYSNGLEYLGYALADFFYGWLVDTIFARTQPGFHVLPVYAVLDLGFDIVDGWHGRAPAGLHVRRAHSRPPPGHALPMSGTDREKLMLHVELLLRTFGLSTTGEGSGFTLADPTGDELLYCGKPVELKTELERRKGAAIADAIRTSGGSTLAVMNVQSTNAADWQAKTIEIFDLGQLDTYRDLANPVANLVRNAALSVGRIVLPSQPTFIRPDPRVAVDVDLCSRLSVNAYGFFAAQAFRSSKSFSRGNVEKLLRIGRLKALRRDLDWARRRVAAARRR